MPTNPIVFRVAVEANSIHPDEKATLREFLFVEKNNALDAAFTMSCCNDTEGVPVQVTDSLTGELVATFKDGKCIAGEDANEDEAEDTKFDPFEALRNLDLPVKVYYDLMRECPVHPVKKFRCISVGDYAHIKGTGGYGETVFIDPDTARVGVYHSDGIIVWYDVDDVSSQNSKRRR